MYFLSMAECENNKQSQILKMTMEAEIAGFKDVHIDARCLEVDAKKFVPSTGV